MKPLTYVLLIIAAAAAFVGGGVLLVRGWGAGAPVEIVLPTTTPAYTTATEIAVYITGAVAQPGVYRTSADARLADIVTLAGGAIESADLNAVNLAARVHDEDHWHIPNTGEAIATPTTGNQAVSGNPAGLIDINTATIEELKTLPGIGDVKAQAIVQYREQNGSFAAVDDLLDVSGIGPATLAAIRDLVVAR